MIDEREITVIGNLIIKNTGTETLNNPRICIRIKPPQNVRLGGKIGAMTHTALMIDGTNTEAWHYFHDNWRKKPVKLANIGLNQINPNKLEPGENLTFANEFAFLQIRKKNSLSLMDFSIVMK